MTTNLIEHIHSYALPETPVEIANREIQANITIDAADILNDTEFPRWEPTESYIPGDIVWNAADHQLYRRADDHSWQIHQPTSPLPEGDPELPDVFPEPNQVREDLLEAVRRCVRNNVLGPIIRSLAEVIGDASTDVGDAIMYRPVGMRGSLELFKGPMPVQQLIGVVLNDSSIMAAFTGETNNCVIDSNSTIYTRVVRPEFYDREGEYTYLEVRHEMPYNAVADRYLARQGVHITPTDDGKMTASWRIFYSDDLSGVTHVIENLESALTIFFRLMTRFPTCQSYSNDLPTFQRS